MSSLQPPDRTPAPVRIHRVRLRRPALVVAIGLAAIATVAWLLRQPVQFSADFVTSVSATYPGAPIPSTTTGTHYAKGRDLSRSESVEGSRRSIVIRNGNKIWSLDPSTKTYYRIDFTPEQKAKLDAAFSRLDKKKLKEFRDRTLIGTEMVNGYLCEKHVVESPGVIATSWVAPRLSRFTVKMEGVMRSQLGGVEYTVTSRSEYRNIKQRRLPSSLFEIPKGYREVPPPPPKFRLHEKPTEP